MVLVGLAIVLGALALSYDYLFRQKVSVYGQKLNTSQTLMVKGINEGIEGFKEVRVLGKADYFHRVVKRTSEKMVLYRGRTQLILMAPRYLLELTLVTFIVLLVLFTIWRGASLQELIPTLSLFGFAAIRLIPSVNVLISGASELRFNRDVTSRLYRDLHNRQVELSSMNGESNNPHMPEKFQTLTFSEVSFYYPNTSHNTLDKVSLSVSKGECIGIIGASGSGKTTVLDTMLGLLEPQSGFIEFNSKPLQENIRSWHENVAYLPQNVFLIEEVLLKVEIRSQG